MPGECTFHIFFSTILVHAIIKKNFTVPGFSGNSFPSLSYFTYIVEVLVGDENIVFTLSSIPFWFAGALSDHLRAIIEVGFKEHAHRAKFLLGVT